MSTHHIAACLAGTILTPALVAQLPSAGPLPGIPATVSLAANGAGTLPSGDLMLKDVGFQRTAPPRWQMPTAAGPSSSLEQVLASFGATGVDINAVSTGLDWILADNSGNVTVPTNQWGALSFSVGRSSQGAQGSRIAAETASSSVGADLFSYVLRGSALPSSFVGGVERIHDSGEMGVADLEVDAVDHFLPIYTVSRELARLMPQVPRIFFSVSNASLANVPTSWWAGTGASGATVFELTYAASAPLWAPPRPFITWRDFGLSQGDDVDALAIDLVRHHVLYSTVGPRWDQILFYHDSGIVARNSTPIPYVDPTSGRPVSSEIGLVQNEEVDAICAMDPSVRANGPQTNVYHFFLGTPVQQFLPPTPAMATSTFRTQNSTQGDVYRTFLVGWPPTTGQGPGIAALLATVGNTTTPAYSLSPLLVRNPSPVFLGDPQQVDIDILPTLAISGFRVTFRWFAVDGAASELAEGWPSLVRF